MLDNSDGECGQHDVYIMIVNVLPKIQSVYGGEQPTIANNKGGSMPILTTITGDPDVDKPTMFDIKAQAKYGRKGDSF